ncbi:MAG TPA: DUF2911 domain-containing protein [Ferruginibacter sp.]|nr:hypothetical protein [Chitinophagaceae bacterium]HRI24792.1 DUF2911 domain-containing protein [Ferruginibacter sp.]
MKYLFSLVLFSFVMLASFNSCAQKDKSKRPSPPALATQKVGEATISINYSQPSIKGRTIGKDLEPMDGKVWRTGANEATVFETDKDVMVEGKALAKGKYGLFSIKNGDEWTIIFNKTWDQWGAFKYAEADDVLRVKVKSKKLAPEAEKMTFSISAEGLVALQWGDMEVDFTVK